MGRIIVRGSLLDIPGSLLLSQQVVVRVLQSPYRDANGAYVVPDPATGDIHSGPVDFVANRGQWVASMPWATGVVYEIAAPTRMPTVRVYCDLHPLPTPDQDLELLATQLLNPPGGEQPVEYITLTEYMATINDRIDTRVEDYLAANGGGGGGGGGGTSDHGALAGLDDDDHPQYLTTARGDARYVLPGSLAAVATTGDFASLTGTIPTSALPPLAINTVQVVATQAAMLALTAERGDMAIRTDTGRTYVLASDSPGTLADWKEVAAAGQVASVAGKTGAVTLAKADVGLGSVDNTADTAKPVSTAQQAAINARLAAGSNLSDLASTAAARANLGLGNAATRDVGTTAGTVTAGDDSRFPTFVVATTATSNSTTTPTNCAGLSLSGLAAGLYEFDLYVRGRSAAAATGVQVGLNWAGSGATPTVRGLGTNLGAGAPVWSTPDDADTSTTLTPGNAVAANSPFLAASFTGMLRVAAGGMTGPVNVTVASEVAASQVQVLPDSFIRYRRIAN